MRYRPDHANVELSVGTVVTAVVPAAIRAAFLGSTLLAILLTGLFTVDLVNEFEWTSGLFVEALASIAFGFLTLVFIGTLVSVAFCGFYLAAVGIPVALILGERLDTSKGLVAALTSALAAAYIASRLFDGGPLDIGPADHGWLFVMCCGYALPAALFFRRDIIIAREVSPWAED